MTTIKLKCCNCKIEFDKCESEYKRRAAIGKSEFFCSLSCNAKFNGSQISIRRRRRNIASYMETPNKCLHCNHIIEYDKKNNKYCSQRCAATHTQILSGHRQYTDADRLNISNILKQHYLTYPKPKKINHIPIQRKCKFCDGIPAKRKQICEVCKFEYYGVYRPLCEFTFVLSKYPDEFDFSLLKLRGMYSPTNRKNNLNGVSRDHLYSVYDGFKNKISPEIIKHPANCELILHTKNQFKYNTSKITLEELRRRILEWDIKYNLI